MSKSVKVILKWILIAFLIVLATLFITTIIADFESIGALIRYIVSQVKQ